MFFLADAYQSRFKCLGELSDLKNPVEYHTQAVNLIPDGHADKPGWLSNLGNSYQFWFKRLGELSDVEAACRVFEQSSQLPVTQPSTQLYTARQWVKCLA